MLRHKGHSSPENCLYCTIAELWFQNVGKYEFSYKRQFRAVYSCSFKTLELCSFSGARYLIECDTNITQLQSFRAQTSLHQRV